MVLVVKNLPANAGDIREAGLTPGSRRSPGGGHEKTGRGGEGRGQEIACVYLAVGSVFPQGSSCIINAESFPGPSQYRSGSLKCETFWMDEGLGPFQNVRYLVFLSLFLDQTKGVCATV